MKEYPILFTAPMVRALIAGSKMQTRRAVKITHQTPGLAACLEPPLGTPRTRTAAELCPYGQPGDRLWVRETFFAYGRWETRYSEKKKRDEWHFIDMTYECGRAYQYAADDPDVLLAKGRGAAPGWWTRPAIFMPRHACRILLDIDAVRVERLNDISEGDVIREGCPNEIIYGRGWYRDLWESINGAGSWVVNPWVWVVEFRTSGWKEIKAAA